MFEPDISYLSLRAVEFVDGEKPSVIKHDMDYDARKKLLLDIVESLSYQIYVNGLFNADPHPGNILVVKSSSMSRGGNVGSHGGLALAW